MSRVSFGTASLHRIFASSARQRLLYAAADAGITHFDTSPFYGCGLAERDLGLFLRGQKSRLTVATKVGLYPRGGPLGSAAAVWTRKAMGRIVPSISRPVVDWSVARARRSLDDSLRRLGCDHVDLLFLHEPDPALVATDEFLTWLASERAQGRLRAWGVAGVAERVSPFVRSSSVLAYVVQTEDSVEGQEADFLLNFGRELQFTYGYFSASGNRPRSSRPSLSDVLQRNSTGSILVSTRQPERLAALAYETL